MSQKKKHPGSPEQKKKPETQLNEPTSADQNDSLTETMSLEAENSVQKDEAAEASNEPAYDIEKFESPPKPDYQGWKPNSKSRNAAMLINFVFILTVFFIFSWVLPKDTVSEEENRELAKFPVLSAEKYLSGDFFEEIDLYYSDTFPFRETFVKWNAGFRNLFGIRTDFVQINPDDDDDEIPSKFDPSNVATEPETEEPDTEPGSESNTDEPTLPPDIDMPDGEAQSAKGIVVVGDTAMENWGFSKGNTDRYITSINAIAAKLNPDVRVYDMVAPTQAEFRMPDKYKGKNSSQRNAIEYIKSGLNSRVQYVDVYDSLRAHINEYIYFRTDHHWTQLGAYYAYSDFAKAIGDTPKPLSSFETVRYDGFLGTFYNTLKKNYNATALKNNPDHVLAYIPNAKYTMRLYWTEDLQKTMKGSLVSTKYKGTYPYMCFINGDQPLEVIRTNTHNGKKIMVVKESYGNSFVPFLADHFEEIHVIDMRKFPYDLAQYINSNGLTDLLFINYATATGAKTHNDKLAKMVNSPNAPAISLPDPPELTTQP